MNLTKENQTLVMEKRQMQTAHEEQENKVKELETSISKFTEEKKQITEKCNLLKSSMEKLKTQGDKMKDTQTETNKDTKELKNQINDIKEKKSEEERRLNVKCSELLTSKKEVKTEIEKLEEKIKVLTKEKNNMAEELDKSMQFQKKLRADNDDLNTLQANQTLQIMQFNIDSKKTEKLLQDIQKEIENKHEQINQQQQEKNELINYILSLKDEYTDKINDAEKKMNKIKKDSNSFETDFKSYGNKIAESKKEMANKTKKFQENLESLTERQKNNGVEIRKANIMKEMFEKEEMKLKEEIKKIQKNQVDILKRQKNVEKIIQALIAEKKDMIEKHSQRETDLIKMLLNPGDLFTKNKHEDICKAIESSRINQEKDVVNFIKKMETTGQTISQKNDGIKRSIDVFGSDNSKTQKDMDMLRSNLQQVEEAINESKTFEAEIQKFLEAKQAIATEHELKVNHLDERFLLLQSTQADLVKELDIFAKGLNQLKSDVSTINPNEVRKNPQPVETITCNAWKRVNKCSMDAIKLHYINDQLILQKKC